MAIRTGCPSCGAILKADDRHAGRTVPCPKCQSPVTINSPPPASDSIDPFASDAEDTLPAATRPVKRPPPSDSTADIRRRSRRERPADPVPDTPPADDAVVDDWLTESPATEPDNSFPDLTDEELAGETISPRKKKRKRVDTDADSAAPERSTRTKRPALSELPATSWRDYLHWVLLLALLPLGISVVRGDGPDLEQRVVDSLQNHPEVNEAGIESAESLHDLAMQFPAHRLDGAFLPADTSLHWVFALVSAGLFLALFMIMWPNQESRGGALLASGVTTGTIGIMLLLGFQWIAFHSGGVRFRGRGIAILLFMIIKFIAFSYVCALDSSNGFSASFFGFTFGVGLCEELCKALPVAFFVAGAPRRDFRTVCLVGLASGVGFGVSEGITYSSDYYNGLTDWWIYLIRFASCVSLHAIWAGAVALLIYRNEEHLDWSWEGAFGFVVYYLLLAMILHGLYDTLLKQDHEVLAFLTAVGSFLWFQWLYRRAAAEAT